jgi:squalene-hopene/tetraprenyl-beta-curcumene cyclase
MLTIVFSERFRTAITPLVVFLAWSTGRAAAVVADDEQGWRADDAARYLDEREQAWFAFDSRGQGANRSTCVSCHTVLPYLLARPALHSLVGTAMPSEQEAKLVSQTKMRVEHWKDLDTDAFGLFYDDSERKKKESWGTEAVFNAAVLAFDDGYRGRTSPSDATRQAFANLWTTQLQAGDHKGSWNWLDFSEAPWGIAEARFFGAALAAIAVGTAPGYYAADTDADTQAKVQSLGAYLTREFPKQDLHNQVWALWAAVKVNGILTAAEQEHLISQLFDKQRDDGGWSLPALGTWRRNDGTPQETMSDGYATGLVLHVVQTAGVPKSDAKVAKGLSWLKNNQAATGAWRCASLVKKRDPDSHTGKFMSDAATAFAVMALSH